MMPRDSLKPFRNRLVTVSGQVVLMHHGGRYGRYPFHNNTRMLLRDLMIEGQPIDHIWLKVPQRYYNKRRRIINQRVKFKAKIVPYVKKVCMALFKNMDYKNGAVSLLLKEIMKRYLTMKRNISMKNLP